MDRACAPGRQACSKDRAKCAGSLSVRYLVPLGCRLSGRYTPRRFHETLPMGNARGGLIWRRSKAGPFLARSSMVTAMALLTMVFVTSCAWQSKPAKIFCSPRVRKPLGELYGGGHLKCEPALNLQVAAPCAVPASRSRHRPAFEL